MGLKKQEENRLLGRFMGSLVHYPALKPPAPSYRFVILCRIYNMCDAHMGQGGLCCSFFFLVPALNQHEMGGLSCSLAAIAQRDMVQGIVLQPGAGP